MIDNSLPETTGHGTVSPETARRLLVVSVLLSLFLAAMDSTVIGTLLPSIRSDMVRTGSGGLDLYPWLVSAFVLAMTVSGPVFGHLSDRAGVRPAMTAALAIFLLGSLAVVRAPDMTMLVLGRTVQGVGAGGIIVMCYTVMGHLYAANDRGGMQGLLSLIWGLSAIAGPFIGAVVGEVAGWRIVFLLNLPVGLAAMALVTAFSLQGKRPRPAGRPLDPACLGLFAAMLFAFLMLIMTPTASSGVGAEAATAVLLATAGAYWLRVRRVPAGGLVPPAFFTQRPFIVSALLILISGAALYGTITLLPLYLSEALGAGTTETAVVAGALGWAVGAAVCGGLLKRSGFRLPMIAGTMMMALGTGMLALLPAWTGLAGLLAGQAAVGLGIGFTATSTLVLIQNQAPPEAIGAYTATVQLLRNIGAAVGVNAASAIQIMAVRYQGATSAASSGTPSSPFSPSHWSPSCWLSGCGPRGSVSFRGKWCKCQADVYQKPACCTEEGEARKPPFPTVDQATRTEFGHPRSSIRLRTTAATATSVARASSLHRTAGRILRCSQSMNPP